MHKNTYKRLVKKLKESFPNMKTKADGVIDYNLKSAVEDSDVNQKALEDAIKMSEADKKFFMGDREAKRKISSPALKKLHLSEALFLNEAEDDQREYWAKKAFSLNRIIASMNDEEAYAGGWLYIWPDGETLEDALYDFGDESSYKELEASFISRYKRYHDGGLYFNFKWYPEDKKYANQIIADAHEWDRQLGLPEIEVKIVSSDFNESLNEYKSTWKDTDESINRKSRKSTLNESIFNRKLSK